MLMKMVIVRHVNRGYALLPIVDDVVVQGKTLERNMFRRYPKTVMERGPVQLPRDLCQLRVDVRTLNLAVRRNGKNAPDNGASAVCA
jgi:hypothetical protein